MIKRTFILFVASWLLMLVQGSFEPVSAQKQFILVLDAGHGGKDPGTHGVFSKEKHVALDITLRVGKLIEENFPDVKVIYTRKTDVFIELHERAAIANRNNADLFISIHVDGVKKTSVQGTSTFVMGLHKNDENLEVAKRENGVITQEDNYSANYQGFDPNKPESYIRICLEQKASLDLSLYIAAFIQDQFQNQAKRISRGVNQAGYLVLWQATMPAVLVETGFLTNPQEEKYLNSEEGKTQISNAIYHGFAAYKNQIEQKSSFVVNPIPDSLKTKVQEPKDELYYRIQILSSDKAISSNAKKFKNYTDIREISDNKVYRYYVGEEKSYSAISSYLKLVREDFKDAFVVAFKNGQKITLQEAKEVESKLKSIENK